MVFAQLSIVVVGSDTEDHPSEDESDLWSPMTIAATIFMAGAMTGVFMTAFVNWCGRVCLKLWTDRKTYTRMEVDMDSGPTSTLRRRVRLSGDPDEGTNPTAEVSGGAAYSAVENSLPRTSREALNQEVRHEMGPEGDPILEEIVHLLNTYRVQDLREGLKSKGLPVSGVKEDLVRRLANGNVWPPQSLIDRVSNLARIRSISRRRRGFVDCHSRAPILAIMTVAAGEAWLTATQEEIRI